MDTLRDKLTALTPEQRALLERKLRQRSALGPTEAAIPRRTRTGPAQMSYSQQQLWFLDQLRPGSSVYNAAFACRLTGELHAATLERAFDRIVERHTVLRSTAALIDGVPRQTVLPQWGSVLTIRDLSGLPESAREAALPQLIDELARRPFDLSRDVLLRALLVQLTDRESVLCHVSHHSAWDYRSRVILYDEIAELYDAERLGRPANLAPLTIQYADFAEWQHDQLQGATFDRLASFWKEQLLGAPRSIELPTDHRRPALQGSQGTKLAYALSPELLRQVRDSARQARVTPYMTLLAAFCVLLWCYTEQTDLCIGSPIAGRNQEETKSIIGFFINTLVMRIRWEGRSTYRELLERTRRVTLDALDHQEMPFDRVVELIRPPRDLSRNPLFQVNFRVATEAPAQLKLVGLEIAPLPTLDTATSKFDLACEVSAFEGGAGYWEFSTELFEESTVRQMGADFQAIIAEVLSKPETPLAELTSVAEIIRRRTSAASRTRLRTGPIARRGSPA
jgi:hypothetical protein